MQYFNSVYLTLLSLSLHIDICSNSVLYIWLYFSRLYIFRSILFQFFICDFAFLVSANWYMQYFTSAFYFACFVSGYWHLQSFSSVCFSLPPSSLHIDIFSISIPYIWFCIPCLCILSSAVIYFCVFDLVSLSLLIDIWVYQFWIFDFAFLVSAYWHLLYFSSVYFY